MKVGSPCKARVCFKRGRVRHSTIRRLPICECGIIGRRYCASYPNIAICGIGEIEYIVIGNRACTTNTVSSRSRPASMISRTRLCRSKIGKNIVSYIVNGSSSYACTNFKASVWASQIRRIEAYTIEVNVVGSTSSYPCDLRSDSDNTASSSSRTSGL